VLLYGGTGSHRDWGSHLPYFTQHFRVVTPDSRGHGRTDNPRDTLSYRLMADDTAALIQKLVLPKPLVCGWSDGGNIALEIGMQYPELVGALVVGGLYTKPNAVYRHAFKKFFCMNAPGEVDCDKLARQNPEFIQELIANHSFVYGPEYWKTLMRHLSVLFLTPLNYTASDFVRIQAPTLVLSGDRDQVLPVSEHITTYHRIPHAELAIVPNADHFLPYTHMAVFNDIVTTFWQRHIPQSGQSEAQAISPDLLEIAA
jgi:pimeloyl-ACP methyl ester carboxylesterase